MSKSKHQGGFAAIAAIFLVVALAALGAFLVSFSNSQQISSAQDVQGSRAYWAARGGIEWALTSINTSSACTASPTTLTIDSFTVVITCTMLSYTEAAATPKLFQVRSIASVGSVGAVGFLERSVSASMER